MENWRGPAGLISAPQKPSGYTCQNTPYFTQSGIVRLESMLTTTVHLLIDTVSIFAHRGANPG